jgi:hypothetical protein
VETPNAFMFWVFYIFPYLPYVLFPCHVIQANRTAIFALDLKSAYEEERTTFGLLSLANLAQNDVLQFHPFTCKW